MKPISSTILTAALLGFSPLANAVITIDSYTDDGDGAIVCNAFQWSGATEILSITGDERSYPADIVGVFSADTPDDPTMTLSTAVLNDTGFDWTGYHVTVRMDSPFTIANPIVSTPGDWTRIDVQQPALIGSLYEGQVDYFAGTIVPVGGTLDFSYSITFTGSTSYSFCQTLVPTPEPSALSLLGLGLLAGWSKLRRRS